MIIPCERLFWCVVDAPSVRGGALTAGLWPLLEDELPVPIEHVWAVSTPIDGARLLICAALKSELRALCAQGGTLTPDKTPPFAASVDPLLLNLLVGPFEPAAERTARRQRRWFSAAAALVTAALLGVGLERRTAFWLEEARGADAAVSSAISSLATKPGWSKDDLAMELLERRQAAPIEVPTPGDAALAVAALIGRWPAQIPGRPQSISASGDTAAATVLVPGDAAAFVAGLKPPEGWRLDEPHLASVDKVTRVSLQIRRATP